VELRQADRAEAQEAAVVAGSAEVEAVAAEAVEAVEDLGASEGRHRRRRTLPARSET
jgi:hypothetical protein